MYEYDCLNTPDRRVRRTRQAIQRALVELILEKGYDAVTVTDVIDRADIGRSTFYAHYTSKQEVLFGNLDRFTEFLRAESEASPGKLFAFSLPMFQHIQEQRTLLRALIGRRSGSPVVAHSEKVLAGIVRGELLAYLPDGGHPPRPLDLMVTGIVGAFMALVREWVEGDLTETPEVMNDAFLALVLPGVEALLAQAPG
ncbi:TetR/AcrR family transcriptional regulator [Sphaerisporangium sp. B11E5]|uniref:TetR/AcrR family transcriptional regulator n=1 Tax=Sphaerisporangium sp. B11E5 TaxID=3153563 RepID=UPI00325DFF79